MTCLPKAVLAVILACACGCAQGQEPPDVASTASTAPVESTASAAAPAPVTPVESTAPAAQVAPVTPVAGTAPVFHIQLWDAHKTNWTDAALADLAAAGFTVVQNGWKGSAIPSLDVLDRVARHGLLYGGYVHTLSVARKVAAPAEIASVRRAKDPAGRTISEEVNTFDPTYQKIVARALETGLRQISPSRSFYKLMLNSERNAPISYDDLTIAEAVRAGCMKAGEAIPLYDRGVWRKGTGTGQTGAAGAAGAYSFLAWFDECGGDRAINFAAAEAARKARPGLLVTTDPLSDGFTYGQYHGMDVMQDWVRVHQAPRDPLSIAYRAERLKCHVRREGRGEVWVGPQLGTATEGSTYAAPADVFEEALWLAVASGARGITCWGFNSVRRGDKLDDDTWGRIRKFRTALLDRYPVILRSTDAPRAAAVLLSKANQVFTDGPYYNPEVSYEEFYRVLLTAHVPTDVLYDEDVLSGGLSRYKVLFLPGVEHSTPELDAAVARFEKAGGRVVRWPVLLPHYKDSEITKGNYREDIDVNSPGGRYLLPHQYRAWRRAQAERLFATVADLMEVRCDNPDVVINVIQDGAARYVVLVNDSRDYGEWTRARGQRWTQDKGVEAKATLTIGSGDNARKVTVTLPPAGVAVVAM